MALAIVDDIAAIGVIAVFFTDDLQVLPLVLAGVLLVAVAAARRFGGSACRIPGRTCFSPLRSGWPPTPPGCIPPLLEWACCSPRTALRGRAGAHPDAGAAVPDRPLARAGP
ncbi:MAG: Na+/H+ antiporter NhaA [Actinobacteria bacterium]|nr:Na+/H+ antiporter NhaA [Actinomycetota bacterium]